jgi:hypothetical protein
MFPDPPESYRKLAVHSSIARRIVGRIGEVARFAQYIGDLTMLARWLECDHDYKTEIDLGLRSRR